MSAKFDQDIQEFSSLSHDDKKLKLIAIMEYIQDKIDFVEWILKFVKEGNVSDEFLEQNYRMIMKATATSNDKILKENIEKLIQIKASEKKDKQHDEEEADNILQGI